MLTMQALAAQDLPHDSALLLLYVHSMFRRLRPILEFTATFLGLILLVLALVIWRLSYSPINSTFMTPYIESGIERYIPDAHPQIAHTLLTWDNADHSIALHADGVSIRNGKQQLIAAIPTLDIRLSLLGLMVGQFLPTVLTVDHPQIQLTRRADGQLYFADMSAAGDGASSEGVSDETLRTTINNLTHAYAMRHLTIYRAVIAIHDEATGRDWSVSLPEISLVRSFAQLLGTIKVELTQKEQAATLELHYTYDHLKALHQISTRFHDINPSQLAGGHPESIGLTAAGAVDLPLSGEIEAEFDKNLNVAAVAANLQGDAGSIIAPAVWDNPRTVTSFNVEGTYDGKAKKLNLANAAFDFGGPKVTITAEGHAPRDAQKHDLDFTMTAKIDAWPMDQFHDLWPKPIIPNPRAWMEKNLTKGIYEKGEATFTGGFQWNDLANIDVATWQGKVLATGASVTYVDGMPPVQGVRAEAEFDTDTMKVRLTDGGIGDLRLQPFTITMTGLAGDLQTTDIPLKVSGPITDVLKLIARPPLNYAATVDLTPDSLTGFATGTVHFQFPLLKSLAMKDVDVEAEAELTHVSSSMIKDVKITDGNLALSFDKDSITVKGPLSVNALPVQAELQQWFHAAAGKPTRRADLSGTIRDEQWKTLDADAVKGTRGSAFAAVHLEEYDKDKLLLSGNLDLANADLHFNPLNWKKPIGIPASLQFTAERQDGKDIKVKSIQLKSPSARADGKALIRADGFVKSASLTPLIVGRTNANIYFTQSEGDDGALRFEAQGKSLDVSGMKGGKDPARADPRPKQYHLALDKFYTGEGGVITSVDGFAERDANGWSAISLHGMADGDHALAIDLTPGLNGQRTFSITCDDFGKMLKGLGLTDTVHGGDVKITGASLPDNPRVIAGSVAISSFSVGKLPVLILLFNATTPFGFSGLVTDSASFEHLKGAFRWTGDVIDLRHVNLRGTSTDMNVEGRVDMNSGEANLSGTMVPFSLVNRILESIPLIGDILTGGDGGGILAVSYGIKGPLTDPKISVNPVSLLTPGFLRNIIFGGESDDDEPAAAETAQ